VRVYVCVCVCVCALLFGASLPWCCFCFVRGVCYMASSFKVLADTHTHTHIHTHTHTHTHTKTLLGEISRFYYSSLKAGRITGRGRGIKTKN